MNYKSTIISLVFGGLFVGSIIMATLNLQDNLTTRQDLNKTIQNTIINKYVEEKVALDNFFEILFGNQSVEEKKEVFKILKRNKYVPIDNLKFENLSKYQIIYLYNTIHAQIIYTIVNSEKHTHQSEIMNIKSLDIKNKELLYLEINCNKLISSLLQIHAHNKKIYE